MTDTTPAIGDNVAPYDTEAVDDYKKRVDEFADAAGEWLEGGEIADEESARRLNDLITGLRRLSSEIEEKRKADKEPYRKAGELVDKTYKALTGPLDTAVGKLRKMLTAYANKKAEAERKAREEQLRKAREEEEAARKAAEAAETRHDVVGESDAAEKLREAERARKEAERERPVGQIKSATGGGRTAGLRTYYSAEITSYRQAFVALYERHHATFDELMARLANAEKRADKTVEIPGIRFVEEKRL